MENDHITEVSKVIGQIEDELRDIKSAKEQIEAIIGSNDALSNSLNTLFETARNMAVITEDSAKKIIAEVNGKVEKLNVRSVDIDNQAQKSVSILLEQAGLAQARLESELADFMQKFTDAVASSTSQNLESIKDGLSGYRGLMDESTQRFTDTASSFLVKQESQVSEIEKLVDVIHKSQQVLNQKTDELKQLGILSLSDKIEEIQRTELEIVSAAKKANAIAFGGVSVCLVVGIIILVRVFMM